MSTEARLECTVYSRDQMTSVVVFRDNREDVDLDAYLHAVFNLGGVTVSDYIDTSEDAKNQFEKGLYDALEEECSLATIGLR